MKIRCIFILALLFRVISANHVSAAFINGIERFNGTVKDASTWEEYCPYAGEFRQDGKLILDLGSANIIDYTTKYITVGVGEIVRVELLEHPQGSAESILYLTTNSTGTSWFTERDDHFLFIKYEYWSPTHEYDFVAGSGSSGHGAGQIFGKGTPPPSQGNPYVLQIERTSSTSAIFSAFASDMTLIDSINMNKFTYPGVPDDLFISLGAWSENGGLAIFDNVTIIPEPGTVLLLGIGGFVLRKFNSGVRKARREF